MIGNKETDLNLFEFQSQFSTEKNCMEYLSTLKWETGFECKNADTCIIEKELRYVTGNVPDAII